ncbi:MAG: tRNA (N(6)-L-threonylcarbamoyladenosine(37)-C(2))-methylthiotransferase MtaB [Clostridia bacterium]|nr:tRNA (N(6)-L-threonylcarbamoyladenosine(37)-C(2))-methylthiotransferase MtaB [Clostridia bacterium]
MNIAFYTLGCKVNQYETQVMREGFAALGHTPVPEGAPFEVAVINSCTVTAESDRKTRQLFHKLRRENPNGVIVLTGCMVQAFSDEAKAACDADIIVGNTDVSKIITLTQRFLKDGKKIFEIAPHEKNEVFNTPNITDFAERTRAYMKIEDGCDRYCTYCIIPYARGFVRSKSRQDIYLEAERLSQQGFSELVLVGINLTSYGKDGGLDLCDAVEAVCSVEGIKRLRLGSLEPDHISDEMLLRFKAQPKFCPQFHLSLQSGCDATLKRMNRHYDTAFYEDLVFRIRKMFPDAAITTDIMVGFAGETEEEFAESLAFFKKMQFARAHVFSYSRRKGTVAYNLPGQVSNSDKKLRSRILSAAAAEAEAEFLKAQCGKSVSVLFETGEGDVYYGYTANYLRVCAQSEHDLCGKIAEVEILSAEKDYCIAKIN